MVYKCKHTLCERHFACPHNHEILMTEHSEPDESGMPTYFGECEATGYFICDVPYSKVIRREQKTERLQEDTVAEASNDRMVDAIAEKVVDKLENTVSPLTKAVSGQTRAINNQTKAFGLLRNEIRGEGESPHEMSAANKSVVDKALDLRAKLISDGTSERNATTDACREVEEKHGIGEYTSFEAFRDAVNTKVRKQKLEHGLREVLV